MSELAICEQFHWTLEYLRSINIKDYLGIVSYMRKIEREQKKAMRKNKKKW